MNTESMSPDKLWRRYLLCNRMYRMVGGYDGGFGDICKHYRDLRDTYYRQWFRKAGYNT